MAERADPIIAPQWSQLDPVSLRGTTMLIGASDTGKSTLARYLFQSSCRAGLRVAYLDGDMGQSTLGLPTTMTVALTAEPGDDRFPPFGPRASYFVGSTTPRGHMLPTVIGLFRLREKALALGAEAIVVDTTGLVETSEGGRALKQWKIELLAPSLVIALQRYRELEPILWPLRRDRRLRVLEWRVSPHASERSRAERIRMRRSRFARYWERAVSRTLDLRKMAVYELDRLARGTLLAFQDAEGFSLGLGVAEEVDRKEVIALVRSPLAHLEGMASIRLGAARWDVAEQREM